jgi:hypothetical protein
MGTITHHKQWQIRFPEMPCEPKGRSILQAQHDSADHQDEGEGAECLKVILFLIWLPLRSYHGEPNHNTELERFACSFEYAVGEETYVVEGDLVPGKPKYTEETNVGGES